MGAGHPHWREKKRVYTVTVSATKVTHTGFVLAHHIKEILENGRSLTGHNMDGFKIKVEEVL